MKLGLNSGAKAFKLLKLSSLGIGDSDDEPSMRLGDMMLPVARPTVMARLVACWGLSVVASNNLLVGVLVLKLDVGLD